MRNKSLLKMKKFHISKAEVFHNELKSKMELAKNDPEVEVHILDYQLNAPLPKVPSADAFYLRQLWMYNFCIYSEKSERTHSTCMMKI